MAPFTKPESRSIHSVFWIAAVIAAIFVSGLSIQTTLRVRSGPRNTVEIEIAHTPNSALRALQISGNSPLFTTGSWIQAEGDDCPVLHRVVWRNVPKVGALEVRLDVRDQTGTILETVTKTIFLGPAPEEPE